MTPQIEVEGLNLLQLILAQVKRGWRRITQQDLKDENAHLRAQLAAATAVEKRHGLLYRKTDPANAAPICQRCHEILGKHVDLRRLERIYQCPNCQNVFDDPTYVEPPQRRRIGRYFEDEMYEG